MKAPRLPSWLTRLVELLGRPLKLLKHPRALPLLAGLYLLILTAMLVRFFLTEPIVALDTDLWYHLTGGSQILAHRVIPHDSFFSFLTPAREWVDYYWLFQVVVASVHAAFGNYGLVILRGCLSAGILIMVMAFLARNFRERRDVLTLVVLSSIYMAVLLGRLMNLRPHLFTYLLLVIMLWVLEWAPRRALWLVPLTMVWVNLHGIVYPLILTVIGAYAAEHAVRAWQQRRISREAWTCWAALALSALAVLCTPHGTKLLGCRFAPPPTPPTMSTS